jgi:glyoxylase-like metal-dependent hydrolase (beta-lactamase superfamily II)
MEREAKEAGAAMCRQVAPGVYSMETGKGISRANVYFVQAGSSWVLIDTALPNCGPLIRKTAASLFGADSPPAAILLTHNHPDHAGSALELAHAWDCPLYVHPDELPYTSIQDIATVEKYASPLDRWLIIPLLRLMPRRRVEAMFSNSSLKDVVRAFDPGAALPGLPGWECIPTPGHTPGHVAFLRSSDRVLISGDAMLTIDSNSFWGFLMWGLHIKSKKISGPPWFTTWNWQAARESVAVLAALEPQVVAPGHGIPLSGSEVSRELRNFADQNGGKIG